MTRPVETAGGNWSIRPGSFIAAWLPAVLVGVLIALTRIPGVFVDGGVHPLGNDGAYHAMRMLTVAQDPSSTHSFDQLLHWPEGLWITWPWAYDYLGGVLSGLLSGDQQGAASAMVFYPLLWLVGSITLVGLIAREFLGPRFQAVCMLAYAAAPITLSLHGVGELDHHSAEHFWFLLGLFLTGLWLKRPDSVKVATGLGVSLGLATAFHTALFIVQLPTIACLLLSRLSGHAVPGKRTAAFFAAGLLLTQAAVLLPSHQFVTFQYAFYYHSWFHLHVAALTGLAVLAICSPRDLYMWLGLLAGAALAFPAIGQVLDGMGFMRGETFYFDFLKETRRPFGGEVPLRTINYFYSGLVWLLPVCVIYAVFRLAARSARGMSLALMVFGIFGLMMLTAQLRFHYFGHAFLVFIPLLMIQRFSRGRAGIIAACVLFLGAYSFSLDHYLLPPKPGESPRYVQGMPVFKTARRACAAQPGLLLVDNNWGSLFRYHADCPLLSNNFIVSQDDVKYIKRTMSLLGQSPEKLRELAPSVRYVFVSNLDPSELGDALLSNDAFDGFEVIGELKGFGGRPVARLYRVEPHPPVTGVTP